MSGSETPERRGGLRGCSGHRGRVRLCQALVCERSVNAGTLVSPRAGDRSSVWETQAESACTRQPQAAEESPRSRELARRAPARARAQPSLTAPLPRVAPLRAGRAADALGGARLPAARPRRGAGRGRSLLTCGRPRLRGSGLRCAGLVWAALGCAPGLRAARQRPLARLRPARLRPAVPGALAGGPRGAGWARGGLAGGRRRRARLWAALRPLGSSLFGQ